MDRSRPSLIGVEACAGDAAVPQSVPPSPVFVGDVKKHGITARAQELEGEFVVMKGSKARLHWEGVDGTYTLLFEELVKAGVLAPTPDGMHNEFTKNYAFSSPSAAAAVVAGRSANGRTHWVVEGSGKTYAEWQEEQVGQVALALSQTEQASATDL